MVAIVVNCFLIAQCGQLQRLFPGLSPEAAIISVVVLEVPGQQAWGPLGAAPGLGITDGAGQKESPGAPGSAALLFLKCFLISAVRTALCSPATLLLPRCAFVLNGRCRSGHHGGTRS